jgi:NADPH:quinone reductase-like Zn-dependent oxidoreductase
MKAAVHRRGVIEIRDVEIPVPRDDQVLVRVHATTICAADYRFGLGLRSMPGRAVARLRKKPIILGMELSGTVESVGKAVTRFRPGDQVFGGTGPKLGSHAEFACPAERWLEMKPVNMTLAESAAVMFGGLTALGFLRQARIRAGQSVLVYGASGSVGVFAVQLAKHFGARVTGVCSTGNLDLVRSLGADTVVDYTKEDFSRDGRVYDAIVDTVGQAGFARSLRALKRGGPYIRVAPSGGIQWGRFLLSLPGDIARSLWISWTGGAKMIGGVPRIKPGDLAVLKELIEAGALRTVIDRRHSPGEIGEAFRYAEGGHKKGHVVILFEQIPAG